MIPTKRWKRALIVGCSHGVHADPMALKAVLAFRDSFRPHTVVHLGDFVDTTAFRSGAAGTSDEGSPVDADVDSGLEFLSALHPTMVLCGNHEQRLWRAMASPSAIIAHCAETVIKGIQSHCRKLKADLRPYTGIWQGETLGNYRLMHGVFYSENATRDHAEAYGNVIHAHTHRAAVAKGRRSDNPTGYCVGTLTAASNMDYASTRRATLSWSQGFVWGEYCDDQAQLWLHENQTGKAWKLPA